VKVWIPAALFLATGCSSTYAARYTFVLENVETSSSARGKINGLKYEEEGKLIAQWYVAPQGIAVELINRSDAPLELAWDASKIFEASELPKSIAPNATAKLSIHPLEHTREANAICFKALGVECSPAYIDHWRRIHLPACKTSNLKTKECGYTVREPTPIFPLLASDDAELQNLAGQKLRVVLPTGPNPHTFVFRIDKVEVEKVSGRDELPPGLVGACPCKKRPRGDEP
jgi:hypothetical protein